MLRRPDFSSGFQGKVFKDRMREGDAGCGISSWMFFRLVGGEVIGSQHHLPSVSNPPGVCGLVGGMQLISSTWWGFQQLNGYGSEQR